MRGRYERPAADAGDDGAGAAEEGLDSREKLGGVEGLGQIVVGAVIQATNLVGLLTAGSQDEDRCFTGVVKCPAQVESADTRQHQIQDDQIGLESRGRRERATAVVDTLRVIPLGQQVVEQSCVRIRAILDHVACEVLEEGNLVLSGRRRSRLDDHDWDHALQGLAAVKGQNLSPSR